jgi:hypothetical protein
LGERNVSNDKKLSPDGATDFNVDTLINSQGLKPLQRQIDTDFLLHLSCDAFEERFIGLLVPTKEADFPRLGNAGDIIALLKKKAAGSVEQ